MDYLKLIKAKEDEEESLYRRMQQDADMLYLKKFVLTDTQGNKIPDIVNVTLNKPAVFAANVSASLGGVSQQVIVESDNLKIDTHKIEDFQNTMFAAANGRLNRRGLPQLNPFADTQFCFRGRTARRVLVREVNGQLVPDIMPWDGRFIRYEMGDNGPKWAAYTGDRSASLIEAEYGVTVKGKTGKFADVWTDTHNEVWVDGKQILEQEHFYGYCPVVIEVVHLGYGDILMDTNRVQRQGESIFFLIRDIVPQLNMLISILQTLNLKLVKRPQQYANKEGAQAEPPDYEDATGSGAITSVDIGGGIIPVDYGDAQNAAQMAYNMMEKAIQEGGYTDIDVGNVRQPFSAVALITIGESKDMVYLPRLASKESLNIKTAEMFTEQVKQIGGEVKINLSLGKSKTFKTSDLDGEYTTSYKYFVKSPKTDIARMAVAQVAERYYPRKYILENVLQVEDVAAVERGWSSQEASLLSPNVKRHRVIMDLLAEAEKGDENAAIEARIMALEMGASIAQVKQGILPEQPQQPNKSGPQTLPLLGQSGQVGEKPPTEPEPSMKQGGVQVG
jgi:hypothetical protein